MTDYAVRFGWPVMMALLLGLPGCDEDSDKESEPDAGETSKSDADADSDADTDADSDADTDADSDADGDTDSDGDTSLAPDAGDAPTGDGGTEGGDEVSRDMEPCPGGGLEAGTHNLKVPFKGVSFTANLFVPESYDGTERTPLILNYHGLSSNANQQRIFSKMNAYALPAGYIVAYPESPTLSWDAGECCLFTGKRDDTGFARELVAKISEQLCVDRKRIYAMGMSNGGFMSQRLACEAADIFAAVAPVTGVNGMAKCEPSRPVSIIHFHGTMDSLVPYNGGGMSGLIGRSFISVPKSFSDWGKRNGCEAEPKVTFEEGNTTCKTYEECRAGAEVTLCTVKGMDHCWPDGEPIPGLCPGNTYKTPLGADKAILDFFARHPMP